MEIRGGDTVRKIKGDRRGGDKEYGDREKRERYCKEDEGK